VGESLDIKKANGGPPRKPAKAKAMNEVVKEEDSDSPLSDAPAETPVSTPAKKQKKTPTKSSISAKKGSDEIKAFKAEQAAKKAAETKVKKEEVDEWDQRLDPDGDEVGPTEDVDVLKKEAERPPPVNSDYLPLPWKGRLGYVSVSTKSAAWILTNLQGLLEYLSATFESSGLQFSNLPNSLDP
jgi:UV DNA damage endonuclease